MQTYVRRLCKRKDNKKNMGRHKQLVCQKCCRVMRSDNLNKHMKVHEKYNENSLYSKSIYSSRASLHKDDESEFSSSATDWEAPEQRDPSLEREAIIKTIKLDAAEYKNKLNLKPRVCHVCIATAQLSPTTSGKDTI